MYLSNIWITSILLESVMKFFADFCMYSSIKIPTPC